MANLTVLTLGDGRSVDAAVAIGDLVLVWDDSDPADEGWVLLTPLGDHVLFEPSGPDDVTGALAEAAAVLSLFGFVDDEWHSDPDEVTGTVSEHYVRVGSRVLTVRSAEGITEDSHVEVASEEDASRVLSGWRQGTIDAIAG